MAEPELGRIIEVAVARLEREMREAAPFLAEQVSGWMRDLGKGSPGGYFEHPLGFPMLRIPWWLEKTFRWQPDPVFQAELAYSTINGYYYIRLIDNVMDRHATVELGLLPALAFFHTKFQDSYRPIFEPEHPFWQRFQAVWFESAEVTIRDAFLEDLDWDQFVKVAGRKTCAAKIPAVAVCYQYDRQDLIEPWSQFLDLYGCWHQMWNDVVTWRQDLEHGTRTYFLSEGERHRRSGQSLSEWVTHEGLLAGFRLLESWLVDLRSAGGQLGSPDLVAYLDERASLLASRRVKVEEGLRTAAKLLSLLEQA